jgi:hypothetical protein
MPAVKNRKLPPLTFYVGAPPQQMSRRQPEPKKNEQGRRIGEDHPRAVLTDHEVQLLFGLLGERDALVIAMFKAGRRQADIDAALTNACLSYRCLAEKFEISKCHVAKIARGARRCQTPV